MQPQRSPDLPLTLHTARLLLRPLQPDDAPAIFQVYAQDPEVTRYLTWSPHPDVEQTKTIVNMIMANTAAGKQGTWVITDATDDALLGMITLRLDGFKADIGYCLGRSGWGKGYMTEALQAVIDAAWTLPTLYRVWAVCDVGNPASARVMAKAGMVYEGILHCWTIHPNVSAEPRDVLCYAVMRG